MNFKRFLFSGIKSGYLVRSTNLPHFGESRSLRNILKYYSTDKLKDSNVAKNIANSSSANPPIILKKRSLRKKLTATKLGELTDHGYFNVVSFATAEEYDLEELLNALNKQQLYTNKKLFSTSNRGDDPDVLYVSANYPINNEPRDIFFFREGSVVFWNFNEIETNNILRFLRPYEKDSYTKALIVSESEMMPYTYIPIEAVDVEGDLVLYSDVENTNAFFSNGKIFLTTCSKNNMDSNDNFLQKYTFSNAMSTSTKLGIWEGILDQYIDSLEYLTDDLKKGRRLKISRSAVLKKTGELFALRHVINLSSDLLDTPDFYWEHEQLEKIYGKVCSYYSISRRVKVMNEKINHCVELAELVSHNLNDAHHVRLEWMIIILIMVEVGFEIVHYIDHYITSSKIQIDIQNPQVLT